MNIIYQLKDQDNLKSILKVLDSSGEGFIALTDVNRKLLGVVTDGDVRRAFLNNEKNLDKIINKYPLTTGLKTTKETALFILKKNHKRHLPVVDEDGVLVNVFKLDDWSEIYRPNKVIIMAGGLGSRLGELTKNTPKPMLNIGDKPMLENLIISFRECGFYNFLISVNYKSEVIKDYFGNGSDLGVVIEYIEERKRMGTAGALSLIKPLPNEPVLVVNGDILSSINYEKMLDQHMNLASTATMAVTKRRDEIQYGVVEIDHENNINCIKEKPIREYYINGGVYVLNPEVFKEIPHGKYFDMPSLFGKLAKVKLKTSVYIIEGFWLDIGLKSDYNKAITIFKNKG